MKIIVTCGPSYEPIDQVRRLTNFSTGKLGITIANYFTKARHDVICLKGESSTFAGPLQAKFVQTFGTNHELAESLENLSCTQHIHAVFHVAALCDYQVGQITNEAGESISSPKFATREGNLSLLLTPSLKVLPKLRDWFPHTRIVGWKYELAGAKDEAFAKAWKQIEDCRTDACVLNGAAYGDGFALCLKDRTVLACHNADTLCEALGHWLANG